MSTSAWTTWRLSWRWDSCRTSSSSRPLQHTKHTHAVDRWRIMQIKERRRPNFAYSKRGQNRWSRSAGSCCPRSSPCTPAGACPWFCCTFCTRSRPGSPGTGTRCRFGCLSRLCRRLQQTKNKHSERCLLFTHQLTPFLPAGPNANRDSFKGAVSRSL